MAVFAAGENGRLGYSWQLDRGDPADWSAWADLGVEIRSEPAVLPNADGRLEVFAIGSDGLLGHLWQLDDDNFHSWSEWDSFGDAINGRPSVAQNLAGRLEVFAVGADGRLGHVGQKLADDGSTEWSYWVSFGEPVRTPPEVLRDADGRLEVVAVGADGKLGHVGQQLDPGGMAHWSQWRGLKEAVHGSPTLCQNAQGRLEVFAVGADGKLGRARQELDSHGRVQWSAWESLGPVILGSPAALRNHDGSLEVFALGASGRLGHTRQLEPGETSRWSDWEDQGPAVSELRPAAMVVGPPSRAEVKPPNRVTYAPASGGSLSADVVVVGAGPAGITISDGLIRAGARVILVESGGWNQEPDPQSLNYGDADGPIVKGHLKYLRHGRRRQVQGSAAIWGRGWCMPFRSIDFEHRPWVPGSGWPLGPADLASYERRAASTLGIDAFPEPAADGSLVRMSYHYPSSPFVFRAMLAELLMSSEFRAELRTTAVGLKLTADRIESVRLVRGGDELQVNADAVVLAAGGIENARLLLLHEGALPVRAAMAGRYFMDHPHVFAGTVQLPDSGALDAFLDKGRTLDVLALPDSTQRREGLLNATVQLQPRSLVTPPDQAAEAELYLRVEQAPNPESRVVLAERLDPLGYPQPYLRWLTTDQDWNSVVRTAELAAGALAEQHGGLAELSIRHDVPWPWDPAGPEESDAATWGNHHMGTTRMAADPADGVVDSNCLVHGTTNLYVAGSSVFPTGGCANPTFMIVALAHRLVDHLTSSRTLIR